MLEELGRAAAPSPFLTSSVVATTALVALGDTTILPLLASGEQTAALLVRPTALAPRTCRSRPSGVPADVLLLPEGDALYAVRGARSPPSSSLDMTRPLAEVASTAPSGR